MASLRTEASMEEIPLKRETLDLATMATMVTFLLLGKLVRQQFTILMKGATTALANHLLFTHFDHQSQNTIPQTTLNMISVAMAFIFRTCIGFAVLIAFTQLLWLTVRQRWLETTCIDSLFSSPNNLCSLLHFRAATKAPVTWTIALLCWLTPLTTIFPPGAISVVISNGNFTVESVVPTFNSSTNTSSLVAWDGSAEDCYTGPGQDMLRLAALTMLSASPLPFSSPCGSNCTYNIGFRGPAWQCQNSTFDPENPFGPQSQTPDEDATFLYTGIIDDVFWLWYSAQLDPPEPSVRATEVISCSVYLAWYDITIKFADSTLFYDNVNITFESPWTGLNESTSALCTEYASDSDPGPFWDNLNIAAVTSAVATQLKGNITYSTGQGHSLNVDPGTLLGMTSIATLSNDIGILLHPPIESKLEALMANTTLTVSDAGYSFALVRAQTQRWGNIYVYHSPLRLYLSYGPVTLLAMLAVALGSFALVKNGVPGDRGFVQILMATRNPDLDGLVGGKPWNGAGNVPRLLKETKLRYKRGVAESQREYFETEPFAIPGQ